MTDYISHGGIRIAKPLHDLVRDEIAPDTGIPPEVVWSLLDNVVQTLGPRNRALLEKRDTLQAKIDAWLLARRGRPPAPRESAAFLREIGYLVPEGPAFEVTTANVDPEIATLAGPQLVVPVDNPRYALNAANARWGSLYDALYGSNVIPEDGGADKAGKSYNPKRGERVVARANEFLDSIAPLAGAKWADVTALAVDNGALVATAAGKRTGPTCCCATTACTSTSRSIRSTRSARLTPRASRTWCSRAPCPRSWTSRIRWRRWTRPTKSSSTATGTASCAAP
jgi:malate synthase